MLSEQQITALADGESFVVAAATPDAAGAQQDGVSALPPGEPIVDAVHEEEAHGVATEIWLVVALAILIAIAFRPAKRSILAALDARANRIRTELEEAQRLREEAQAALANIQRRQRDAMAEAEEIVSHARQEAERLKAKAAQDLEDLLKRREAQAMDRIQQAEAAALAEVRGIAVDVAVAAARQVITARLGQEQAGALVDQSIEELPGKLH